MWSPALTPAYGREYSVVHVARGRTRAQTAVLTATLSALVLLAVALFVPSPATAANFLAVSRGVSAADSFAGHAPNSCVCHGDLLKQWQGTMHAKAWEDPVYQYARGEAVTELGAAAIDDFCIGCHAPAALMADATDDAGSVEYLNGVNCGFCHQVTGTVAPGNPGNLSLGFPLSGPDAVRRAQIMDPKAPHQAEGNEFFTGAEYCGSCHNVSHPVNGLHLETTYSEWAQTPYAEQGITCQNCHMHSEVGGAAPFTGQAASGAPTRDNLFAMTFVGANVAQGDAELNTAQLQKAATVELEIPEIVAPGESVQAQVTVTNTGAGHSIPTGVGEIREVWLEVYAQGADGEQSVLSRHDFNLVIRDAEGNEGGWDFWNATEIVADNRLHVGEPYTEQVNFTMPASTDVQNVVAVLRYKTAPDEVATEAGVDNPTTDMALAEKAVYSTEDAKAAGDAAKDDGDDGNLGVIAGVVAGALVLMGGIVIVTIRQRRQSAGE